MHHATSPKLVAKSVSTFAFVTNYISSSFRNFRFCSCTLSTLTATAPNVLGRHIENILSELVHYRPKLKPLSIRNTSLLNLKATLIPIRSATTICLQIESNFSFTPAFFRQQNRASLMSDNAKGFASNTLLQATCSTCGIFFYSQWLFPSFLYNVILRLWIQIITSKLEDSSV